MAQKAIRDTAHSQGQRTEAKGPKELFIFNQFEEMIYGQKLPGDRVQEAKTETRAKIK